MVLNLSLIAQIDAFATWVQTNEVDSDIDALLSSFSDTLCLRDAKKLVRVASVTEDIGPSSHRSLLGLGDFLAGAFEGFDGTSGSCEDRILRSRTARTWPSSAPGDGRDPGAFV